MKAFVESYGCTMNHGEGGKLEDALLRLGHELVSDPADAELIVLNTCTVIAETQNRMLKRAKEISESGKKLVVTGCMAAIQPDELRKISPDAQILAPRDYEKFPSLIGGSSIPIIRNPTVTSVLPISQGCLGACTYCITRFARGSLSSYPLHDLVSEADIAISTGTKELLITSQDTACYGFDIGLELADLLNSLTAIPGKFMIRIGMMNPNNLIRTLDKFIQAWSSPKIYKFIHLPVQSGSPDILNSMNRQYSPDDFKNLVNKLRRNFPELMLSTDVITGFPGETDADHRMTVDLIKEVRPDTVNVTRYSPRPNTPAASFKNQVPGWISKERSRELTKLRFDISLNKNSELVGQTFHGIVSEVGKPGSMIVRIDSYRPVVIHENFPLGSEVYVNIIEAKSTYLFGETSRDLD